MEDSIVVEGIRKKFGAVEALRGVNFRVRKGSIVGLLGPNGAGKTTLIRILTTLLVPDAGTAFIEGIDVIRQPEKARHLIGLAGQYAAVDENLTGRENLAMVGRLYHMDYDKAVERAAELLEKFHLTDAADRTLKTYSGGMRRRLDLAASLVNRPPVLFLDEPTTGLDPQSRFALWAIIKELIAGGTTVLLTTQYMEEADHLAETITVMDRGTFIAEGTPAELKSKVGGDVIEVHLRERAQTPQAHVALRALAQGDVHADIESGVVTLTTRSGAKLLTEAVRALDAEGVAIEDLHLRRPSLDEVFLTLTGHATKN